METPRTDEISATRRQLAYSIHPTHKEWESVVPCDFARELERENIALKEQRDRMQSALDSVADQVHQIKLSTNKKHKHYDPTHTETNRGSDAGGEKAN